MVSQNVIPSKSYFGGAKPFAFTEQGVTMLSSVFKNKIAIQVNISIIRVFTQMRKILATNKDIIIKLEELERKGIHRDKKKMMIFKYIKKLEENRSVKQNQDNRKKIGFK